MSDQSPKFEFDDELLSAYLDGELSDVERAAVETRLAADPAAQHLLHELRSVSQAVQAMPQEVVGRDLSADVIRRARVLRGSPSDVVRGSPDPAQPSDRRSPQSSSPPGDVTPKIPIFRTTRALLWASLALAAGLLIMIVQSGDESTKKLPPLAQNKDRSTANQPTGDSARGGAREPVSISGSEPAPPPSLATDGRAASRSLGPGPAGPAPSQPAANRSDFAKELVPAAPPLAATSRAAKEDSVNLNFNRKYGVATAPAAPAAKPSAEPLGEVSQSAGRAAGLGGKLDVGAGEKKVAGKEKSEISPAAPDLVVHVVANREALEGKAFDQLLQDKNISVEPHSVRGQQPAFAAGRLAPQAEHELVVKKLSDQTANEQAADIVLVEAPRQTIDSFLSALNQDSDHYLGIEVDEDHQTRGADAKAVTRKIAGGLSKYNRGTVPQRQKASAGRRGFYFYDSDDESLGKTIGDQSPRGGPSAAPSDVPQERYRKETPATRQQSENLGRAWRVPAWNTDKERSISESRASAASRDKKIENSAKLDQLKKIAKSPAETDTDNLRVLFLLSPDESSPPSPPAVDRTK